MTIKTFKDLFDAPEEEQESFLREVAQKAVEDQKRIYDKAMGKTEQNEWWDEYQKLSPEYGPAYDIPAILAEHRKRIIAELNKPDCPSCGCKDSTCDCYERN